MSKKALIVGIIIGWVLANMSRTECTGSVISFPPEGGAE